MKKQILSFLLIFITIISSFGLTVLADDIKLYVNDAPISCDVPPIIRSDRTLVPARALLEALDAVVSWNPVKRQVTARTETTKIILAIDSNVAYVNSVVKVLDTPPIIHNDRTLIPARFVSEALNYDVKWVEKSRSVYISPSKKKPEETKPEEDKNEPEQSSPTTIKSMVYSASDNNFVICSIKIKQIL